MVLEGRNWFGAIPHFRAITLKKKLSRQENELHICQIVSARESDTDNNTCIPLNMEGFAYRAVYSSSFCSKKQSSFWHWTVAASLAATLSVTDTVIKTGVKDESNGLISSAYQHSSPIP